MSKFSNRLKMLRKEKGLTQQEFGDIFHLNKSSISKYENGSQMPEADTLEKIADFFDVTVDFLFGRSEIRKTNDLHIALNTVSTEGLDEDDIEMVKGLIKNLKKKNQK
ncbi:helix-turn-helix transcriptional regulator [Acidaminobacter sp. JC074]|uniref:helix-turn-helix domain-containing protein n=1 Tax=Acidaminobacter sp. JC074 TaxID=2530199 RepID=UPI001F0E7A7E|nr:helix-turn-helix transcriptional regulator [Acidaminobacter sp. JC074]MCH4891214.1 helix-turn-helix transcriptional regulator [Acidaminobacter sp. JC074]